MKETGILMRSEMVIATLEGRKLQTRRILDPQPLDVIRKRTRHGWMALTDREPNRGKVIACRYGEVGDILWVKETFAKEADGRIVYRADNAAIYSTSQKVRGDIFFLPSNYKPKRWKPGIFMPRWASRLILEITDIRVQRLQDISEKDAKAEGVKPLPFNTSDKEKHPHLLAFADLWESINGKTSWDDNDFVWAITFKRIK